MKTPITEIKYKLENSQPQVENAEYTGNKIKLDVMKQNLFRKLVNITYTDMKNRALKK